MKFTNCHKIIRFLNDGVPYPIVWRVTRSSVSSPLLSSASIWWSVKKPSTVSSPSLRGKLSRTTFHSSSDTSSPLVRQLNKLNSVLQLINISICFLTFNIYLDNVPFASKSALVNISARTLQNSLLSFISGFLSTTATYLPSSHCLLKLFISSID